MSGGEGRKLSNQVIQLVQNRIEQCLQLYMNKKEITDTLIIQDNVEASITELVWQRLEEENQEFFKAYYLKLLVKDQIMEFNRLLSEQVELMRRISSSAGISPFTSNGSHVSPAQHIPSTQNMRLLKTDVMRQPDMFRNCGSSNGRKVDGNGNLFLSQNSNVGFAQMMNGKSVKTEGGFAGSSPFTFSLPTNYLESRAMVGDASVSSFSSVDSNAQHLNEPLLDGDTSSFGFLGQIQPSYPELATDFSNSDLLDNYCRPPFPPAIGNNFVNLHGNVDILDPEAEGARFQCFGGN